MPRRSRTPYVLLGLLSFGPMTGYDLKATIERTVGHFWQESYGQLYPTLKALHADGLVTLDEQPDGGRTRKVYGITDAGRDAFRAWLAEPAAPSVVRNEMMLKVFMASLGDAADLRPHLERALAAAQDRADALSAIRHAVAAEPATDHQRRCWLLTVDLGLAGAEATVAWATTALANLEGHP